MNGIQSAASFGLALFVGLSSTHQALGQAAFRGMDNNPGASFHARDVNQGMMVRQTPAGFQPSFKAEPRMTMPEVRQINPVPTPIMTKSMTPVFDTAASLTRLVPAIVQPVTNAANQAVRAITTPVVGVVSPGSAPTTQTLNAPAAILQSGRLDVSPTAIQTDKTPRPIVKLPAAGPATSVYLKASTAAGYTFVVSSNKYAISLEDQPGSYIQGESGTAFELSAAGAVVIKEGVAVVASGREPLIVKTRLAEVKIGPDSFALIEAGEFGPCKVVALKTSGADGIVATLAQGNSGETTNAHSFVVEAATELVMADHQLSPEELMSSDGVDREHRKTLLDNADWNVVSAGLPVPGLIERHPLLAAAVGHKELSQTQAIKTLVADLQLKNPEAPKPKPKQATADDHFVGIGYSAPVALPGVRGSRHALLSSSPDGNYNLKRGTVVVDSEKALMVDTPNGSVLAAPHSVVVISADDSRTQVLNLHDMRTGAVKILVGKTSVPIGPGSEARVFKKQPKARTLALGDGIGRRSMRVVPVGDDAKVVVNEFSIPDALVTHPILKQFSTSRTAPDRVFVGKIVKTAAAVAFATAGSREVYSSGSTQ